MTARELPAYARFWMVCRQPRGPGQRTTPRQRYPHRDEAERAARKLAQENDAPFLILETVAVVRPGDPDSQGSLL